MSTPFAVAYDMAKVAITLIYLPIQLIYASVISFVEEENVKEEDYDTDATEVENDEWDGFEISSTCTDDEDDLILKKKIREEDKKKREDNIMIDTTNITEIVGITSSLMFSNIVMWTIDNSKYFIIAKMIVLYIIILACILLCIFLISNNLTSVRNITPLNKVVINICRNGGIIASVMSFAISSLVLYFSL